MGAAILSQSRVTTVPGQTLNKGITWPDTEWSDGEVVTQVNIISVLPIATPELQVISLGQSGRIVQIRIIAATNQTMQTYTAKGNALTSAGQTLLWEVEIDVAS